jgi:Sec-independent protein translocase protein TatA
MTVGHWQLLIVLLVVLLLFGGRLGKLGKALGRAVGALRRGIGPSAPRGESTGTARNTASNASRAWQLLRLLRRLRGFPFSLFR